VPQVPQHNIGVNAQFVHRGWTATSQYRVTGRQFEDDLNLLVLRPAHVVDAMAARQVTANARAFVAVENLFDAAYDVARTPTLSLGLPRAVRGGLHLTWR
jgi:outer membrane receptor protein involved in Fe transport